MNGNQSSFLDIMRVLAAQLVLINHILTRGGEKNILMLGNFGVLIFFILSGFLICYTTLEKKKNNPGYSLKSYFVDRFFRIFTPYLPCLIFILILDSIILYNSKTHNYYQYFSIKHFVANIFMFQQFPLGLLADKALNLSSLKLATFGSGRPLWTVAIEWWIYLFFGWVFFKNHLIKNSFLKFFSILVFVGIFPLFNMVAGTGEGLTLVWFSSAFIAFWYFSFYKNQNLFAFKNINLRFLVCILSIGFGVLVVRILWVSLVQTQFKWEPFTFYDFNFGFIFLLGFILVFIFLGEKSLKSRKPFPKFLADYSYSLYLTHYSLIHFMVSFKFLESLGWITFSIYFLICNLLGIIYWWSFERHYPYLKLLFLKKYRG